MDNSEDRSKKSSGVCMMDTSEDESEGESSMCGWRAWLSRVQAERARRGRDDGGATSSAPDSAAPGPSGRSSSHKSKQIPPTDAERREFWSSISGGNTSLPCQFSTKQRIQDANNTNGSPEILLDTLNKLLSSASKNAEKYTKYKERFDAMYPSTSVSTHTTHSSGSGNSLRDMMTRRNLTIDALRATNKKFESRSRKRTNSEADVPQPSTSGVKKQKNFVKSVTPLRPRTSAGSDIHITVKSDGSTPEKVRKISPNVRTSGIEGSFDSGAAGSLTSDGPSRQDELISGCSLKSYFNIDLPPSISVIEANTSVALEDIELPSTPPPLPEMIAAPATPPVDTDAKCSAEEISASTSMEQRASKAAQTVESVDLQLNQALLSLLECPVCLECMEPPMVQCRRGHLVCRTCSGRMPRCPVCRASFTSVRNRAMEQVAEKLRYPCRHACGAAVLLRLRARHEASCQRRSYACPLPACADLAPLSHAALLQHHQDSHPDIVLSGSSHTLQVNVCTSQKDWMVFAHEQLFHVNFATDARNWYLYASVTYVGPKRNAKKYIYEIATAGTQSSRKLVYSRETHSDLDLKSSSYARGDAFSISIDHALNFIRPERHSLLSFDVTIVANRGGDARDSGETS